METESPEGTPKYFYLLNETDKSQYLELQVALLQATEKRHRGHRLNIFNDCLNKIKDFAQRGDENDWKRCCVCGVCFLKCGIALNSHQMKFLTNKCKSSINGALKKMNYKTTSARGDINPELVNFLTILKGNTKELRQWSVRTPENYEARPLFLEDACVNVNVSDAVDPKNDIVVTSSSDNEIESPKVNRVSHNNIVISTSSDKKSLIENLSINNITVKKDEVFSSCDENQGLASDGDVSKIRIDTSIDDFDINICSYTNTKTEFFGISCLEDVKYNDSLTSFDDFSFLSSQFDVDLPF